MRETKRRKRLLSLFTTVILITSSAWTSFAYAEGEEIIQDVQNEIVQELSSEPQLIPVEETEEIIPQEDVEQDVGEEQIVEEEQVVEEPVIEEAVEEPVIEESVQPVVEEEAVIEQAPAMAPMMAPEPVVVMTDPNPNTGNGTVPTNPGVHPSDNPVVGTCEASPKMFNSLKMGSNVGFWNDIKITVNLYDTQYGQKIDFAAENRYTGKPVKLAAVYVKGGNQGGYLYDYRTDGASSDTGLHAPKNTNNQTYADVSHLVFYYCPPVVEKEKEIKVEKVWKDQYGNVITMTSKLPQVTVGVFDGETRVGTITLNNANHWKSSLGDLSTSKDYTLVEDPITGLPEGLMLDSENSGEFTGGCDNVMPQKSGYKPGDIVKCSYVVVNKLVPVRYKEITVEKEWKNQFGITVEDNEEYFPYGTKNLPEVTVDIYDGATVVDTLKLNNNNGWEDTSIKLVASKDYTLKERPITNIPEGFMLDTQNSGEFTGGCDNDMAARTGDHHEDLIECSYVVVNKLVPERYRDIEVTKVWKDEEGQVITDTDELPEVIVKIDFTDPTVQDILLKLNHNNGWKDKANNILASYEYQITEESVTGLPEGFELKKTGIAGECIGPEIFKTIHVDRDIQCMYTVTNTIGEEDEFEGRIKGFKFNDLDMDGFRDENEPGFEGVTIYLYNVNPSEEAVQPAATAVTDENGAFSFMVEAAGTYYLKEKLPEGWVQSAPANNLFMVTLTEKDNMYPEDFEGATAYMFGNYRPVIVKATIEGYKFNDSDRDGVWDEVESGLQGWTITLWKYLGDMDESGTLTAADVQNMKTAVTDANGYYKFTELEDEATYYISENIGSMPYWYQTYPVTGPSLAGTGRMHVIAEVEDGDVFKDVNFGNYYFRPDDGDNGGGDGGGGTTGGGGGGTTVRITPGGGTEEPIVIEAFGPEEEVIVSLPVFSAEEPEEVVLTEAVMSPDANPQTSDAGIAMQMQMLGLSIAAMYVLRRKI